MSAFMPCRLTTVGLNLDTLSTLQDISRLIAHKTRDSALQLSVLFSTRSTRTVTFHPVLKFHCFAESEVWHLQCLTVEGA